MEFSTESVHNLTWHLKVVSVVLNNLDENYHLTRLLSHSLSSIFNHQFHYRPVDEVWKTSVRNMTLGLITLYFFQSPVIYRLYFSFIRSVYVLSSLFYIETWYCGKYKTHVPSHLYIQSQVLVPNNLPLIMT